MIHPPVTSKLFLIHIHQKKHGKFYRIIFETVYNGRQLKLNYFLIYKSNIIHLTLINAIENWLEIKGYWSFQKKIIIRISKLVEIKKKTSTKWTIKYSENFMFLNTFLLQNNNTKLWKKFLNLFQFSLKQKRKSYIHH